MGSTVRCIVALATICGTMATGHRTDASRIVAGPFQGPLASGVPDGWVARFAACAGEDGRVGLCWIESEPRDLRRPATAPTAGGPEQEWAQRPRSREAVFLNVAVLGQAGIEWRTTVPITSFLSSFSFPVALGYSEGSWHLLVALHEGLLSGRFRQDELRRSQLLSNVQIPVFNNTGFWMFGRADRWHVFWTKTYWPRFSMPDFMGGRQRQRIDSLLLDGQGAGAVSTLHEMYKSAERSLARDVSVIDAGGRYDALYVQSLFSRNESSDLPCELLHVRDLQRGRRPVVRVAAGPISSPVAVTAGDGDLHVFWLSEVDGELSAPNPGECMLYYELMEAHFTGNRWSKPGMIQQAGNWLDGSLAAAVESETQSIMLVGRPFAGRVFECIVHQDGRWVQTGQVEMPGTVSRADSVLVNQTALVYCGGSVYALITTMNKRLYWCFVTRRGNGGP